MHIYIYLSLERERESCFFAQCISSSNLLDQMRRDDQAFQLFSNYVRPCFHLLSIKSASHPFHQPYFPSFGQETADMTWSTNKGTQ